MSRHRTISTLIVDNAKPEVPNRLELDLESLSSSLRHGWGAGNCTQATAALNELKYLFPDLLPAKVPGQDNRHRASGPNCYNTLKLETVATDRQVVTSFFRRLREVMRNKDTPDHRESYTKLLDAAFILRKPRLRLSHDLVAVSNWLEANDYSSGLDRQKQAASMEEAAKAPGTVQNDGVAVGQTSQAPAPDKPPDTEIIEAPLLLKLLLESGMISTTESQALLAQMCRAPELPLESLVLKSGYVTGQEMASLQLAVMLVTKGTVTRPQVLVALYDHRNSGVRMAESLQNRGWLSTNALGSTMAVDGNDHEQSQVGY